MSDLEQPALPDSAAALDAAPPVDHDNGAPADPSDDTLNADLTVDPQAPVDDEAEEEIDGVKLRGKKDALEKWKAERLMQSDYTRKTQEVAEHRRALEAERTQFQQTAQLQQAFIKEVAQVVAIDERLAQFANFDFNAAADADPVQALKLHNEYTRLQAQKGQLVGSITQKQQAQAQEAQRANARQILEAQQVLARDIKGWSPDLANNLVEYGKKQGYAPEVLSNVTKPEFVKTLHKAYLYDQLMEQRAKKPQTAPAPPVTRVSGGAATTTKKLSDMSDAEFIASRRKYIQNHR